jgi:glucose-1-phosphate adenylyltransferase
LVLAGDHIYKMDYAAMIARHVETNADMTVGVIDVEVDKAKEFGVMSVDNDNWVTDFAEKPDKPDPIPGNPKMALASMGIYIFNTDFLFEQLIKDADTPGSTHDFGKDIIPSVIKPYRVLAYPFRDLDTGVQAYWRDVGTIDAYWSANMELIGVTPELNLYDERWPIWTYQEQLPPAKFVFDDDERRGMAVDSMISGGCIVSGAQVSNSLLFSNVRVNSFATVDQSVIMPDVEIGRDCQITKAIIDKGCEVPAGTIIGENREDDERRFYVSEEGVVLVTSAMLGKELQYAR